MNNTPIYFARKWLVKGETQLYLCKQVKNNVYRFHEKGEWELALGAIKLNSQGEVILSDPIKFCERPVVFEDKQITQIKVNEMKLKIAMRAHLNE